MKTVQSPFTHAAISPERLFWLCAGVYFMAWIIVPTLAIANVPIDTLEGYAWGHEWQLGVYKHPPLASWVLEALAVLTGRAPWAHFLANELAVITTFWAVWQTGRRILGETEALAGAFLLAAIPYYNIIIPEFNPNVLQLPFWALTCWSFHRAVKDNKAIDWLALGVWSAAALYTKYSSALLIAALAGLMLYHPVARKRLASKGPWLTIIVTAGLMIPHILWLFKNDFMPFTYAEGRMEHPPYGPAFITAPALFLIWQAATLLPAALVFGATLSKKPVVKKHTRSFDEAFIWCVAFGPAVITCLIAAFSGGVIRNMWATPFWNFIGLWAVYFFSVDFKPKNLRRFAIASSFVFLVALTGFFSVEALAPYVTHKVKRVNFSGPRFAAEIAKTWHDRYRQPLKYVVGDTWIGGNIAYYTPERPHQLTDGDYKISPWINPADLKKYGGVIVWCGEHCNSEDHPVTPAYLHTLFPQAEIQQPLAFPQDTGAKVPPAMVEWALLPPQEAQKTVQNP